MAKTRVKITDSKKKWNQLESTMRLLSGKGMSVFVGILEEDFNKPHAEGKTTLGKVATFNEFGTSRIPARSFIRAPFDAHQGYEKLRNSLLKRVVSGVLTIDSALNILGSSIAKSFIKNINDGIEPANAESTVDRKLSDLTLVDTGEMRDHITYKITK